MRAGTPGLHTIVGRAMIHVLTVTPHGMSLAARTTGAPPLPSWGAWTQTMMKAMKALLPTHTSVAYGSTWKKCTWHTPTLTMCRRFDDLASVPLRTTWQFGVTAGCRGG